jgi:hypothetical protein
VTPEEATNAASQMLDGLLTQSSRRSESDFRESMFVKDYAMQLLAHKDVERSIHEASHSLDGDAWLCELGAMFVGQAENIPPDLRDFIVKRLTAQARPTRRGTPTKHLRSFAIMYVIARVAEQGFDPTRNITRHGEPPDSACSIVREAMKRLGDNVEESNVEKIWGGRLRLPQFLKAFILGDARIPSLESLYEIKSA